MAGRESSARRASHDNRFRKPSCAARPNGCSRSFAATSATAAVGSRSFCAAGHACGSRRANTIPLAALKAMPRLLLVFRFHLE